MIEYIIENYPDLLTADDYDDCILGVVEGISIESKILYSTKKILSKLINDGISYEEALEYFEFNIKGTYIGEHTPVFLNDHEI
jgi:hypothetical protein